MKAKFFMSGGSESVRIPKELRFSPEEKDGGIEIRKINGVIMLIPERKKEAYFRQAVALCKEHDVFSEGRAEEVPSRRETF